MNWLVLDDSFSWKKGMYGIEWIYWCSGAKTQEGEIGWDEIGIQHRTNQGALVRSAEDLHPEVLEKALPLMKVEVKRRTTKTDVEALSDEILEALGDRKNQAMSLSKAWLKREPRNLVSYFRHYHTSYDADPRNGCDRYTATLSAHNDLFEILTVYRTFKDRILEIENYPPYFEYHVRLANLPHKEIFHAAMDQVRSRDAMINV